MIGAKDYSKAVIAGFSRNLFRGKALYYYLLRCRAWDSLGERESFTGIPKSLNINKVIIVEQQASAKVRCARGNSPDRKSKILNY